MFLLRTSTDYINFIGIRSYQLGMRIALETWWNENYLLNDPM